MRPVEALMRELERRTRPCYVLAGPEHLLRDEAEGAILRAVFGDADPGTGLVVIEGLTEAGQPVEPAAALDELRTVSLLAGRKVVSVRRADALVRGHTEAFLAYLAEPDPSSVLVLHVESWDRRRATEKALDRLAVDCQAPFETDFGGTDVSAGSRLGQWLTRRAVSKGLRLTPDAVVHLIELAGTSLAELDSALEAISLARGEASDALSPEDVAAHVAPSRAFNVFRVAELASVGRTAEALAAAGACFEQGLPDARGRVAHGGSSVATRLIWAVARRLETLYRARGVVEEGGSVRKAAPGLGVPPFRAEAFEKVVLGLSLEAVEEALELAFETEFAFKRGELDPRFAVERLVLGLGKVTGRAPVASAGRGR
jgi:DNA polymerase III delta subunit